MCMFKVITRLLCIILISAFGLAYFFTITELSASGETIASLKQELQKTESDNLYLTVEVSRGGVLQSIEAESQAKGMVADSHFVYLSVPSRVVVSKK